MHLRVFVLAPLLELDPDFVIPGLGKAQVWLDKLDKSEVERLA
jgi:2-amino-4-hydroxy-6-hydroxymethyldihydropteridine diphosphokinase